MTATFLGIHTGSFSTPAAGNPTVVMVEAAYRHHGLDARYLNCEVTPEALADAVAGARAMGWAGFNCSLPHKVAVIDHLERPGALGRGDRRGQHRRRHRRAAGRPQHRRPGLRRVAAHRRRPGRTRPRRARRRGCRPRGRGRDGTGRRGVRHRRQPRRAPRRGARPRRDRGHRRPRDVRALGPHVRRARRRRRRRQRHVGRLRRRRGPGRRRPRHPARRVSWSPTSSSRHRARPSCGPPRSAAHAPSTASGCSSGRGPWPCGTGPASSPTGTSCGPPRPRALGLE